MSWSIDFAPVLPLPLLWAAIAIAVGVVVVTIAAAYLLGRRKGKRRQTVLEIRRI